MVKFCRDGDGRLEVEVEVEVEVGRKADMAKILTRKERARMDIHNHEDARHLFLSHAVADELIGELVRALQVSECYCRCGIHGLAYIGQDHVPQPECSRMFCKRCAALARAKAEGYGG